MNSFRKAVETVDEMRGGIAADEFKATFLRDKIEVYEDLIPLRRRLLRPMAPLTFATLQTLGIGQETKEVG